MTGLDSILGEAEHQLSMSGMAACMRFLQRHFQRSASTPTARLNLLLALAHRLQIRFPQAALDLLEQAPDIPLRRDSVLTFKAKLLDSLGKQEAAQHLAATVVHDTTADPEQRLQAVSLLIRSVDDPVAIDVARDVFNQLGRPLSRASSLLSMALKAADWPMADQLIAQLKQAIEEGRDAEAAEGPRTHVLWCASEPDNVKVMKRWAMRYANHQPISPPPATLPVTDRRLRIGYLSSDFREHPTARLINGLLRHHDRSKFELFMYCSGWDDGSPIRRKIESHFDHRHSVSSLSDEQAARLIRSHAIDVLVELNGPTRARRLGILACRPASVQIGYLGWPGSYGGHCVDYIVADAYVIPEGHDALYPEKIIRLNATYQINDFAARTPLAPLGRVQCGLPNDGRPVLGMFNAINKVRGDVWKVWMQILQRVPDALLWLLDPGPTARRNIGRVTQAFGIDTRRVIATPPTSQEAHLARLQCCDLMLDPWPYGGHTSTSDALFAGVPVVALAGTNFASRVNGSLLYSAGLGALVQPDTDAYLRTVVGLLNNGDELARLKQYVRHTVPQTDLFNAERKVRQMETAFLRTCQRHHEGKPPVSIRFGLAA